MCHHQQPALEGHSAASSVSAAALLGWGSQARTCWCNWETQGLGWRSCCLFVGVCCSHCDKVQGPKQSSVGTEQENKSKEHKDTMVEPESCKHREPFSIHGKPSVTAGRTHSSYLSSSFLSLEQLKQAHLHRRGDLHSLPLVGHLPVNPSGLGASAQSNEELTSDPQQTILLGYAASTTHKCKLDIGKFSSALNSWIQKLHELHTRCR